MDDDIWSARGRYSKALDDEELVVWKPEKGGLVLPMLIVRWFFDSVCSMSDNPVRMRMRTLQLWLKSALLILVQFCPLLLLGLL
jgi:hypothetical protein